MRERFTVAAHLSAEELAARYRAAGDPVRRSQLQMMWLLVSGRSLAEVAAATGYSTRWVREVVKRYNAAGTEGLPTVAIGGSGGAGPSGGPGRRLGAPAARRTRPG